MATHLNQAAVEWWLSMKEPVEAALKQKFIESGLDPELVEVWTAEILNNVYEEEGPSGAPRIRGKR